MKKLIISIAVLVLLLLVCCVTQEKYYYNRSGLNNLKLGETKANVLRMFPGEQSRRRIVPGMEIRAAQRSNGKLLEVGEVLLLTDGRSSTVSNWFLFEDGLLVQWGRPEDWQKAAANYNINFNPSPGVPRN